jgi:DNA-binding protein H-NS
MAKQPTYAGLQRQIQALHAKAAKLRDAEKAGVVAKIKEAIKVYEISPNELFGGEVNPAKKSKSKGAKVAKFSDGEGNTWHGRGPRPEWLREAIAAGKQLDDFVVKPNGAAGSLKVTSKSGAKKAKATPKGAATATKSAKKAPAKSAKAAKKGLPAKFKDDAGNAWSGRGSQPKWLKEALAAGKKLEELRA